MSEDELKKLSEQYDQMTEKFQKEKDEYVIHTTIVNQSSNDDVLGGGSACFSQ